MHSTRASRCPSDERWACGPLDVAVESGSARLRAKVVETLALFDRRWGAAERFVRIAIEPSAVPCAVPAHGSYLRCERILVDAHADGLRAVTDGGVVATSRTLPGIDDWDVRVPPGVLATSGLEDVEEVALLALTTAWRSAGWIPFHVGAVVRDRRCMLLCASSGGGKSTMTAALVRSGWRALGDDKVLLDVRSRRVAGLQHTFNLDPRTRRWFPEVGDLERLPRYSTWTTKRKVRFGAIWDSAPAESARPTDVLVLRRGGVHGIAVRELPAGAALGALARQTVFPWDARVATPILAAVASAAGTMRAFDVAVGDDAYADAECVRRLEEALR